MFAWANKQLEKIAETVAPPPNDPSHKYTRALSSNDESTALACLNEGLDPYASLNPQRGTQPIHLAAQYGCLQVFRTLVGTYRVSPESFDTGGNTPLHYAAGSSSPNALVTVQTLISEFSVSYIVKNANNQTPYDVATQDKIRQYLLPMQLQAETREALANGGAGLPKGIDLGGMTVSGGSVGAPPVGAPPMGGYSNRSSGASTPTSRYVADPMAVGGGTPTGSAHGTPAGYHAGYGMQQQQQQQPGAQGGELQQQPAVSSFMPHSPAAHSPAATTVSQPSFSPAVSTQSATSPAAMAAAGEGTVHVTGASPAVAATDPNALPEGWMEVMDPASGRPYYVNQATHVTTWERPGGQGGEAAPAPLAAGEATTDATAKQQSSDELPPGWIQVVDPSSGNPYYVNQAENTTQWERPVAAAPTVASSQESAEKEQGEVATAAAGAGTGAKDETSGESNKKTEGAEATTEAAVDTAEPSGGDVHKTEQSATENAPATKEKTESSPSGEDTAAASGDAATDAVATASVQPTNDAAPKAATDSAQPTAETIPAAAATAPVVAVAVASAPAPTPGAGPVAAPTAAAPTSGQTRHSYAHTGGSSLGVLRDAKYRPDGFDSSSSNANLQKKYGHEGTATARAVPAPPRSGSSAPISGNSIGSTGSNPYAGGVGALPQVRASSVGNKGRYLAYDAVTGNVSSAHSSFGYDRQSSHGSNTGGVVGAAPYSGGGQQAAPSSGNFTMFNPAQAPRSGGGAPAATSSPAPAEYPGYQQQALPATAGQYHHQQQPAASPGTYPGYQQPSPQQQQQYSATSSPAPAETPPFRYGQPASSPMMQPLYGQQQQSAAVSPHGQQQQQSAAASPHGQQQQQPNQPAASPIGNGRASPYQQPAVTAPVDGFVARQPPLLQQPPVLQTAQQEPADKTVPTAAEPADAAAVFGAPPTGEQAPTEGAKPEDAAAVFGAASAVEADQVAPKPVETKPDAASVFGAPRPADQAAAEGTAGDKPTDVAGTLEPPPIVTDLSATTGAALANDGEVATTPAAAADSGPPKDGDNVPTLEDDADDLGSPAMTDIPLSPPPIEMPKDISTNDNGVGGEGAGATSANGSHSAKAANATAESVFGLGMPPPPFSSNR